MADQTFFGWNGAVTGVLLHFAAVKFFGFKNCIVHIPAGIAVHGIKMEGMTLVAFYYFFIFIKGVLRLFQFPLIGGDIMAFLAFFVGVPRPVLVQKPSIKSAPPA